ACAVVSVEVFMKQQVVPPIWILLELQRRSIAGPKTALVPLKQVDEAVSHLLGKSLRGYTNVWLTGGTNGKVWTKRLAKARQRLDKQICRGEPYRTSPV